MGQLSLPVRLPRNETAHIHTFIYISEAEQLAARGSESAFQCIAEAKLSMARLPHTRRCKGGLPALCRSKNSNGAPALSDPHSTFHTSNALMTD